jgi:hypothetical protein
MRISNLEARLALREIEAAALSREIASVLTSASRRAQAIPSRDANLNEASLIRAELHEIRRLFPQLARH